MSMWQPFYLPIPTIFDREFPRLCLRGELCVVPVDTPFSVLIAVMFIFSVGVSGSPKYFCYVMSTFINDLVNLYSSHPFVK